MNGNFIYYCPLGRDRVKLGGTADPQRRLADYKTYDAKVKLVPFLVSDWREAEKALKKLAVAYQIEKTENYRMTEEQAREFCLAVVRQYNQVLTTTDLYQSCVGCHRKMTKKTLNLYDGERCFKCYDAWCHLNGKSFHEGLLHFKNTGTTLPITREEKDEKRDAMDDQDDDDD